MLCVLSNSMYAIKKEEILIITNERLIVWDIRPV